MHTLSVMLVIAPLANSKFTTSMLRHLMASNNGVLLNYKCRIDSFQKYTAGSIIEAI